MIATSFAVIIALLRIVVVFVLLVIATLLAIGVLGSRGVHN
jgi:hypothetical protein